MTQVNSVQMNEVCLWTSDGQYICEPYFYTLTKKPIQNNTLLK